jgi:hypothetical protein
MLPIGNTKTRVRMPMRIWADGTDHAPRALQPPSARGLVPFPGRYRALSVIRSRRDRYFNKQLQYPFFSAAAGPSRAQARGCLRRGSPGEGRSGCVPQPDAHRPESPIPCVVVVWARTEPGILCGIRSSEYRLRAVPSDAPGVHRGQEPRPSLRAKAPAEYLIHLFNISERSLRRQPYLLWLWTFGPDAEFETNQKQRAEICTNQERNSSVA